jgi:hypothetical protein
VDRSCALEQANEAIADLKANRLGGVAMLQMGPH